MAATPANTPTVAINVIESEDPCNTRLTRQSAISIFALVQSRPSHRTSDKEITMQTRSSLTVGVAALFVVGIASIAHAQATRTWVSGLGDDVNPCSRTAPCKTFAGAISKTAAGGEIDALDPAGYGAVTITKSITIDGNATLAAILASGTTGIIINGAGIVVTLRGLSINGAGTSPGIVGVRIISAGKVFIERSVIFGFQQGTGRGVSDERTSGSFFMTDTIVRNNSQSGVVFLMPAGGTGVKGSFHNCRFEGNGNGGLVLSGGAVVTVKDSVATGNTQAGFFADSGPGLATQLNLQDCVTANNGQGITVGNGSTVRISQTQITNNTIGLNTSGTGLISSYGTNNITANGSGNGPPNGPPIGLQ